MVLQTSANYKLQLASLALLSLVHIDIGDITNKHEPEWLHNFAWQGKIGPLKNISLDEHIYATISQCISLNIWDLIFLRVHCFASELIYLICRKL